MPTAAPITEPLRRVEDHCADGLALLLEQFKDKPRLAAVLCAFLQQIQELDAAAWQLLTERSIDAGVGAQLDVIGRIVGEPREGRSDTDYRPFLRARILVNRSSGLTEEILTIVRVVLGDVPIALREEFPAAFTVRVADALAISPSTLISLLQQAKAAGVRVLLEYSLVPDERAFTFAPGSLPELDPARGFGSALDPSVGGALAGVAG
jgi:hypothetical protein